MEIGSIKDLWCISARTLAESLRVVDALEYTRILGPSILHSILEQMPVIIFTQMPMETCTEMFSAELWMKIMATKSSINKE